MGNNKLWKTYKYMIWNIFIIVQVSNKVKFILLIFSKKIKIILSKKTKNKKQKFRKLVVLFQIPLHLVLLSYKNTLPQSPTLFLFRKQKTLSLIILNVIVSIIFQPGRTCRIQKSKVDFLLSRI